MIITKTPFRISFCGGGSDIADFYKEYGGCVLSTSINRYMYIMIHPYFNEKKTALKYSQNEIVENIRDIEHSIFRCVLYEMNISGVEICTFADVPSGTGLGSSVHLQWDFYILCIAIRVSMFQKQNWRKRLVRLRLINWEIR